MLCAVGLPDAHNLADSLPRATGLEDAAMPKQTIAGKVYDTETAEELASASAEMTRTDIGYWEETLYRTPQRAYFLAGGGGPATKWARPTVGGGRIGSSGIRALSEQEARAWVEKYARETYETIFDAPPGA